MSRFQMTKVRFVRILPVQPACGESVVAVWGKSTRANDRSDGMGCTATKDVLRAREDAAAAKGLKLNDVCGCIWTPPYCNGLFGLVQDHDC
ncbi:hypothetical protein [Tateyamaria sp. SN3-11]|uniref:hypothetical protein n=1 Tax=Tateyamaria sp. SN3-11 TaxID=3092147 RepID=UPI0039ED644F